MSTQAVVLGSDGKEGKAMTRRGFALGRRLAALAAGAVLTFTLAGDRSRAATVPATLYGQDPLEVLSLSVKPNVFVVLDNSGSMMATPYSPIGTQWGGDFTGSKMYQAKQVLKAVFQANQTKAQFLFGNYKYTSDANANANMFMTGTPNRFLYSTQSWAAGTYANPACTVDITTCPTPNPATVSPGVEGPSPSMASTELIVNSLSAYQWIQNSAKIQNNVLVFSESGGGPTCTVSVATGFYRGQAAAVAIQNAMNSCKKILNTYVVNFGSRVLSVTLLTRSGTTATATTSAPHNLLTGAIVTIAGADQTDYNGSFTVTVTGPSTFTYTVANAPATPATGTKTATSGTGNRFTFQGSGVADFTLQLNNPASTIRGVLPIALAGPLTRTNDVATATTYLAHGLVVGAPVRIMGAGDNAYNGAFTVLSVPTPTTFTYRVSGWNTSTDTSTGARAVGPLVTIVGGSPWTTGDVRINLLQRGTGTKATETFDPDGASTTLVPTLDHPSPKRDVTTYFLRAQKFWNGETVFVDSSGNACGIVDGPPTNPPTVTLELTTDCAKGAAAADSANIATFTWAGGQTTGVGSCQGFKAQVPLVACDQLSPPQYGSIGPFLENQLLLGATGSITGYTEVNDGTGTEATPPSPGGLLAAGNTPLAQSSVDIRGIFADLWKNGQTSPALNPIKDHVNPKEKTIVIMVTDGLQNCSPFFESTAPINSDPFVPKDMSNSDAGALGTAATVQKLYDPAANGTSSGATVNADGSINGDAASSVTTYVVGYGLIASGKRQLDVMAWGGSGMQQTFGTYSNWDTWTQFPSQADRNRCKTCSDAFLAPDPETLKKVLQSVIDIGAQSGEFSAQQAITESVFEYVDRVTLSDGTVADAAAPSTRYKGIVPTRIVSSFTLPGFLGQLRAYQNDGAGNSVLKWSAGDKLRKLVTYGNPNTIEPSPTCSGGMCSCPTGRDPDLPASPLCVMSELGTTIKRRIYTTSRNGVYTFDPTTLMAGSAANRVQLWPPDSVAMPGNNTSYGILDAAYGLPTDNPSCYLLSDYANCQQQVFADLQKKYRACMGTNLPSACTGTDDALKLQTARAEARELILAFVAGARPIDDAEGTGWKRASSGELLYTARSWILADSELATPAVVTPPSLSEPDATPYVAEYKLFRDGAGANPRTDSDAMILQGFGLTQPDDDGKTTSGADNRSLLKPVMTVVYAPANDMLHAFRAGPNVSPSTPCDAAAPPANTECGGEELWGFIPFDQLNALGLRFINEPQTRANHVFTLARGIRFADVFVPGAWSQVIGGVPSTGTGVWRRVLYFGRGIGGKYVTALDVTAPGPYTMASNDPKLNGPIPLWSRGNPDTQDGLVGGSPNNSLSTTDADSYARMGQTWSMPTVAYVNPDRKNPLYKTARRSGIDFAIFMGSGYGNPNAAVREGTTHYTLDALSGDVIAAVDVEEVAKTFSLSRTGLYPNAIVANSVSFNRSAFTSVSAKQFNVNPHPWSFVSSRVYVGDLHGRLWKFLTAYPDTAIPAADLGAGQPVGTAVALQGENIDPRNPDPVTMIPNIFLSTGADSRAAGPFRNFSLLDTGVDTDTTTVGTEVGAPPAVGVTTFPPVHPQFVRTFDQGAPEAICNYQVEAVFRGTIQPTSSVECSAPLVGAKCTGTLLQRVFFGGTRLSTFNTKFAPPTPLACGTGDYPCRSQFDSILYALGVETGQPAYDLNASTDDAYRIFRDSRISAISFQADPDPNRGGARFTADEGLMKSTPPKPPPPPGVPPTATTASANVVLRREPGQPAPAVQYGSTVCQ